MKTTQNDVILYSTGCPKCRVLEAKLTEAGIPFTENHSVDEMLAMGLTEAPVLSVDGQILGFMAAVRWIDGQ